MSETFYVYFKLFYTIFVWFQVIYIEVAKSGSISIFYIIKNPYMDRVPVWIVASLVFAYGIID